MRAQHLERFQELMPCWLKDERPKSSERSNGDQQAHSLPSNDYFYQAPLKTTDTTYYTILNHIPKGQ